MVINAAIIVLMLLAIQQYGLRKSFPIYFSLYTIGCAFPIAGPFNLNVVLIIIYFFCILPTIKEKISSYPLLKVSVLAILSLFLSALFARGDKHWPMTIFSMVTTYGTPFLFFVFVREYEDIKRLVKSIFLVGIGVFCVSIVDFVSGKSVWLIFMRSFFGEDYGWDMAEIVRFGISRVQSVFLHSVSYGYYCVSMFSFFLLFFYNRKKNLMLTKRQLIVFLLTLVIGALLTGSRSTILPILIAILLYYRFRLLTPKVLIPAAFLVALAVYFAGEYFSQIYLSIVDSDNNAVGSTSSMRSNQLDICLRYFYSSPIFGLGPNAIADIVRAADRSILGAESVWFGLLVNQGILGVIAYVFIYIRCYRMVPGEKFKVFVFLGLQVLVHTLTSTPGFDTGFFMCLSLLLYRLNCVEIMEKKNGIFC